MGTTSTYQYLGIPTEFGVCLLLIGLGLFIAPYAGGMELASLKIPKFPQKVHGKLKVIAPVLLVLSALPFVPIWTPLLAQRDYLQALDFLNKDDANHRLAAVQFFDHSAQSSLEYHWLMLQQIPTAIRAWAGPVVLNRAVHVAVLPTLDPTLEPATTPPLPDRPDLLVQRAAASANRPEVVAAFWAISGRNLAYETPNRIPPRFVRMDRAGNFDDLSGPPQSLTAYREQLEQQCAAWVGQNSQAIVELSQPVGTDIPEQRFKRWIILSYLNLSFSDLNHINLAGVDMTGSQLNSAGLAFTDFTKVALANARLDQANLWGAHLAEADMSRISASETDFGNTDLRGTWLVGAYLAGSNFITPI